MSIRNNSFVYGEYYHIYNRGNSKQIIFHDNQDYIRFIDLLFLCNTNKNLRLDRVYNGFINFEQENKIVYIGAYCLMPNHFHIIFTQTEDGSISKFMQKLTTAYVMYYNRKYKRTGSLFEGKFKSKYINNDIYFKYLFSYIHLNPVKLIQKDWKEKGIRNKHQALEFLNKYRYSSYLDYLEVKRSENILIEKEFFPDYFPTKEKFQLDIFEWLSYKI